MVLQYREGSSFTIIPLAAKRMENCIPQGQLILQYFTLKSKFLKYCLKKSSILQNRKSQRSLGLNLLLKRSTRTGHQVRLQLERLGPGKSKMVVVYLVLMRIGFLYLFAPLKVNYQQVDFLGQSVGVLCRVFCGVVRKVVHGVGISWQSVDWGSVFSTHPTFVCYIFCDFMLLLKSSVNVLVIKTVDMLLCNSFP